MNKSPDKYLIGVDLGGTTTKLGIMNLNGEIIYKWEIPTDHSDAGNNIVGNIGKSIDKKIKALGKGKSDFLGIGMGAPGPVDQKNGVIYDAVNLGWEAEYRLQYFLEKETSLPSVIENDANCAAIGEMWKGAGSGAKDLVCVTLGTGVGGGVIINGEIAHGKSGAAGEIGHITAVPEGGVPCNCGRSGCLETIASATGIVRIATEMLIDENEGNLYKLYKHTGMITAKDVFDSAHTGDTLAQDVIKKVSFHLGLVLANIANTLNPEKIVIGGGVSSAGDLLLKPTYEYFERFSFIHGERGTMLELASLGNDAGVIGAGWLVLNKIQYGAG